MSSASDWIIKLWPIVCARALRPVSGIILGADAAAEVAESVFEQFLEAFPKEPGSWETVQHWLTSRVAPEAMAVVAAGRRGSRDWQAGRDPQRCFWEQNPDFDALRSRDADGALTSHSWSLVEPILWRRSGPLLRKIGVSEDDARDVFMETLAELTLARPDAGPLEKMLVFEELPRFFDMMVERRGISWLRKISARKRAPVNPHQTERLDAPDNPLARSIADPATLPSQAHQPWASAGFDQIQTACRSALTDFEWHLLEALFVEGTATRLSLAGDPWVLEQLEMPMNASESKRRRRLNLFLESALSKLGAQLEQCDF